MPWLLTLLLLYLVLVVWTWRRYGRDTTPDERHAFETDDGVRLVADRFVPKGERRGVVVTCHGFGVTRVSLDLWPGHSVVEHLVDRGWEVWNVDLRGAGHSAVGWRDYSVDDHIRRDVPAILDGVCRLAATERVHWVGHSMGGVVMYGHLGRTPDEARVVSVCGLGSPGVFRPSAPTRALITGTEWLTRITRRASLGWMAVPFAPLVPPVPLDVQFMRLDEFPPAAVRRAYLATSAVPRSMARQVYLWCRRGAIVSLGDDDYTAALPAIRTPVCLVAGAADRLAPPATMQETYERLPRGPHELVVVGTAQGFSADYSHGGLLGARNAARDVYPVIDRWLARHEARGIL